MNGRCRMHVGARVWLGLLSLLWSLGAPNAVAQPDPEFELLPSYANSVLERSESRDVPEYRLILGKLRVIGNQIRSEERWLSGDLTRLTYRIPSGHTSQSAFEFYKSQLKALGAEILFSCVSRDCGSSSEWATDVFGIAELYGIDREQNYLVARLAQYSQVYYIAVYTIMRGNQRVYAHLDVLATESVPGKSAARSKVPRPSIALRDGDFAAKLPDALADFVQYATAEPDKQVWVVVHTSGDSHRAAVSAGSSVAERVKLWLTSRGLDAKRIRTLAVGPLAPSHNPGVPADRVELFLLDE